ncbi:MAG: nitrous oxide reductase family maturation protein NosD [Chloroflexi bacterium]|nr:nitrous oxide reductase family maturation protein NosD [Chloroflexota bacterium]
MAIWGSIVGAALIGSVLVVAPEGPYRTIPEALAAANPGDVVEVRGGVHAGGIVVDRAVTLQGIGKPVVDGGGRGTVVKLVAPGATMRGFTVRSSGADLNRGDAGIAVQAPAIVVEENRLEDVLNGISLDNAPQSVIRHNSVRGKDLPAAERGDGLRLWYSSDVLVEANEVNGARDCVIWYSTKVRLLGNRIENGRYGLHFMFDDSGEVTGNVLRGNSVGAYLMYSRGVAIHRNYFDENRGPSGFGLGLKDVDDLRAEENWIVGNRVGVWIDSSPRSLDSESRFRRNVLAFNDIGLTLQPAIERNTFVENVFWENLQQVSVQGGGALRGNHWNEAGSGNYWSDYRGFDADGDGLGDIPYRAEALFHEILDRRPALRLLQFGLAGNAVEFAAQAFPTLRPPPKLVDEFPLMTRPALGSPEGETRTGLAGMLLAGAGLMALAGSILGLTRTRPTRSPRAPIEPLIDSALVVSRLTKRFGRHVAVADFDLRAAPGEIVALWGPNGAGKSTVLKCVLGLVGCSGQILVGNVDARRNGKRARRVLGYVPQDVALAEDLTVAETIAFFADLKRVGRDRSQELLELVGIAEHAGKPVGSLSGGMRQRLALALALLASPPLLLLDEPTTNLDAAGREHFLRLLVSLRTRGTAIVFASHRLDEVESIADRVVVMEQGRVAFSCRPDELCDRLGLQIAMRLRVGRDDHEAAVAVLRAGGLRLSPNGQSIGVVLAPHEKVVPIRLLERSGIAVTDFSIDDAAGSPEVGGAR